MAEDFSFDDFFVGADEPGIPVSIQMKDKRGNTRTVTIGFRSGLNFADLAAAQVGAVRYTINQQTGEPEIEGIEETEMAMSLLTRAITSWPFTKNGEPVPVTRENVNALLGLNAVAMVDVVKKLIEGQMDSLAPFAQPSDAA